MNPLTRRRFIALGGGAALWATAGCSRQEAAPSVHGLIRPSTTLAGTSETTRPGSPGIAADTILVVVQLMGGNDALNTLIPTSGAYRDARPTLAIAGAESVALGGITEFRLHPSLAPLADFWDQGHLAFAAGVAFDGQDRSHFEARDLWWRAQDGSNSVGWLARWMNSVAAASPDSEIEGFALGFGPRALSGSAAPAVANPGALAVDPPPGLDPVAYEEFLLAASRPSDGEDALLTAARSTAPILLSASKILADIADPFSADAYGGRASPGLEYQLATAAALIRSRPNLRVVTVGVEGFDTHADQLVNHASRLAEAASAVAGFWESLSGADRARTTVMTISEFGRRAAENDSGGTDHGRGGLQFFLGGGVAKAQLIGDLDLANLVDGDLPMRVNEIEVYADALRWLGGPVAEVLGVDPSPTGLLLA